MPSPRKARPESDAVGDERELEGYGMRCRARCEVVSVTSAEQIAEVFARARRTRMSVGLRGSGCSYGDAALNAGNIVLDCSRMNHILAWDPETGEITVEPGVTIEQIWRATLSDGWWPAVVPGTMAVSAGGAAAANIHGKNQWRDGSFGEHIVRCELLLPYGERVTCSPDKNAELFFAAIGGWGLLGALTSLTLRLRRIYSGLVHVRQSARPSLDTLLVALDAGTHPELDLRHLVAWIDTSARGARLGRGLLKTMRELGPGEDPHPERTLDPERQPPPSRIAGILPTPWIPVLAKPIAKPLGIRLANHAQWRRGTLPGAGREHDEHYVPANFMLNFIPNFKRIYRPGGLIQHQTFAPRAVAAGLFHEILRRSQHAGVEPSLAVLKTHRPSPFLLNYLPDGYSLALDYAMPRSRAERTLELMDELNALVASAGGSFFLAKDSTLHPHEWGGAFSPEALCQFAELKAMCDPHAVLQTDLYRRVIHPALDAALRAARSLSQDAAEETPSATPSAAEDNTRLVCYADAAQDKGRWQG